MKTGSHDDVRLLSPDEAEDYSTLRREMLAESPHAFLGTLTDDNPMNPAWLRQRLSEPMNVIVGAWRATSSGTHQPGTAALVAVAGVYRESREKFAHRATIWGVYVTPSARGAGLGERVVSRAVAAARGWPGVRRIGLSVSVRSTSAIRLYESLGFRAWGTEPDAIVLDGVGIDEIHLSLELLD